MPGNRRQSRRQGVVYGPPRQPGRQSENGVLIGRFLGLGILLLTLGVLAAGALAFVNDQPSPQATPLWTIATTASFTSAARTPPRSTAPSVPASLLATLPPTVAPSLTPASLFPATLPPVAPTVAPPLVHIGEGFVTFGTQIDDLLHIQDPRSTFTVAERIVWSAHLARRADSIELRTQILKADPSAEGGLRLIAEEAVSPLVRDARLFSRRVRPELLEGPGVYTVRYLRGDVVLSEGSFIVTP